MAHLNGSVDHDQGEMENVDEEEPVLQLEFLDEVHHSSMLKSLNMMRKNRHFCDVILHVCAWLYNQTDFTRVCTVTLNVQVIDDFFLVIEDVTVKTSGKIRIVYGQLHYWASKASLLQ